MWIVSRRGASRGSLGQCDAAPCSPAAGGKAAHPRPGRSCCNRQARRAREGRRSCLDQEQ